MLLSLSLVIIFITISHSLFGAGILTFGVPLLLVMGMTYDFINSLLVPLSLLMSTIILWQDRKYLRIDHYFKSLFFFALPLLLFFSYLNLHSLNIHVLKGTMSFVLILFGLGRLMPKLQEKIFKIIRRFNIFSFMFMGALHGYANMGGSIMIPLVTMDYHDKIKIRLYNSLSFSLFTFFQLIIHFVVQKGPAPKEILLCLILGVVTHQIFGNKIHQKINAKIFYHLLTILMIFNGLILAYQALAI